MADHAWCSDPSRDAAVRAAEDGRTAPLPTLAEAIARPFAEAAERSSTVSKTGEGQSGMRTERVVLEIAHDWRDSPCDWDWDGLLRFRTNILADHESVRVVEDEKSSDADAEVLRHAFVASEIKRLKADAEVQRLQTELEAASGNSPEIPEGSTQAASGGGEGEPVAWGRRSKATGKITFVTFEPPVCIWSHENIVPLYERQPLPPGPEGAKPELPTD
jgi:hypothetical protein